jgi:phosphopantetheinyl transferase
MKEIREDDIEKLKRKLRSYTRKEIGFNEPHFTQQLMLREGKREEVIKNLLDPNKLFYSYQEKGKYGDIKHCLHFNISNTRTMILPVIFDINGKKSLYRLTYIMRYRPWQSMLREKRLR